jgi:hypothetical protein
MTTPHSVPDAREVDRVEALATANDSRRADEFLSRCLPGSAWTLRIRTAEVAATVLACKPLGSFDQRDCTCLSFRLALPVPVEPRLRFQILSADDPSLSASGLVRPWND